MSSTRRRLSLWVVALPEWPLRSKCADVAWKKVVISRSRPAAGVAQQGIAAIPPFGMLEFRARLFLVPHTGLELEHEAAKAGVDVRTGHFRVVKLSDDGFLSS